MKFSEIERGQWDELSPYLDTCLLPVTGLTGEEAPYEATEALERLRDLMDGVEIPFKGRVVTYPALHYIPQGAAGLTWLGDVCGGLKSAGFRFVIIATLIRDLANVAEADLVLKPAGVGKQPDRNGITIQIRELWEGQNR